METFIPPEIPKGYFLMAHLVADSSLIKMRGEDVKVALWLIASANIEDKKWYDKWQSREIIIKRGEIITSVYKISQAIDESEKTVRTSIKRLSKGLTGKDGFLKIITPDMLKRANAYSHIKVLKYELYQNMGNYVGKLRADGGQTAVNPQTNCGQTAGNNLNKYNTDKEDKTDKGTGDDIFLLETTLNSFRYCNTPSDISKRKRIEDMIRQGVPLDFISTGACEKQYAKQDFYTICKDIEARYKKHKVVKDDDARYEADAKRNEVKIKEGEKVSLDGITNSFVKSIEGRSKDIAKK